MPNSLVTVAPASQRLVALLYGLVCHGLFVGAVLSAMVAMYQGMRGGYLFAFNRPVSLVWNAMLLLQFPLLHSFLLSPRGNRWLLLLAPKAMARDLVTTLFTMIASAQMIFLYLGWSPIGPTFWEAQGWTKAAISLAYLLSWLFLAQAMADSGLSTQTGFLGWSSVYGGRRPCYGGMPQGGLFRHTRHPVYLAFAIIMWSVPVWTLDQLLLALWMSAYCVFGPMHKEKRYLKRYGQAFADYRRRVPYFLPWPRPSSSPSQGPQRGR